MGSMLQIEQCYMGRVWDRDQDQDVGMSGATWMCPGSNGSPDPFNPGNVTGVLMGSDSFSCILDSDTPFYSLACFRKDAENCRLLKLI